MRTASSEELAPRCSSPTVQHNRTVAGSQSGRVQSVGQQTMSKSLASATNILLKCPGSRMLLKTNKWVWLLLLLCNTSTIQSTDFKCTKKGLRPSNGKTLSTHQVRGTVDCAWLCLDNPACTGYIIHNPDSSSVGCELRDQSEVDHTELTEDMAADYYSKRVNVLREAGVSCEASDEYNPPYHRCELAMDGIAGPAYAWVDDDGANAWIRFDFGALYHISRVRMMQVFAQGSQFKDVDLEFSDGSKQRFTLTQRTGTGTGDVQGRWWDELDTQPVTSSFLTVRAVSLYTEGQNGFKEVEVIGLKG